MKTLSIITLLFLSIISFGQEEIKVENTIPKKAVYFELGGNGGFYSVNYDRIIFSRKTVHLSLRVGFAVYPNVGSITETYLFPIEVNFIMGKQNHFIELGLGQVIAAVKDNEKFEMFRYNTLKVGYKYVSKRRLFLRVGAVAHVQESDSSIWPGIGIGKAF